FSGELRALAWDDIDLKIGTVHVTKAWDEKRSRVKPPKTRAGVRHVPIEPALAPLLEVLHAESEGTGLVVAALPPMRAAREELMRFADRVWLAVPVLAEVAEASSALRDFDPLQFEHVIDVGLGILAYRRRSGTQLRSGTRPLDAQNAS